MALPKRKMALFKRKSRIEPEEILKALWRLPVTDAIQPPTSASSPAVRNVGSSGQAAPAPTEDRNYLGESSRVSGKLNFQGPARIDGQFEGEITAADRVTIGENAVVTAKIKAASIVVAGTVNGEIIGTHRIELRPSARVLGKLTTPKLVVHEDATFEAHCAIQPEGSREDRKVTVFPRDEHTLAQAGGQKHVA
jgi:cytoskeletal protein CcmA (bactofilin family)